MTKWDNLKEYINSRPVGTIISRKEILTVLHEPASLFCTIDTYKGILLRIGVLEWQGVGKYKILYHVRPDLSSSEAKKAAYSKNEWRKWFNDFREVL